MGLYHGYRCSSRSNSRYKRTCSHWKSVKILEGGKVTGLPLKKESLFLWGGECQASKKMCHNYLRHLQSLLTMGGGLLGPILNYLAYSSYYQNNNIRSFTELCLKLKNYFDYDFNQFQG